MEDKNIEFTKWVDDQLKEATSEAVRTEFRVLRELCDAQHWFIHIRQRDLGHLTALHLSRDLPPSAKNPLAMQLFVTTKAIRKMREMGVTE